MSPEERLLEAIFKRNGRELGLGWHLVDDYTGPNRTEECAIRHDHDMPEDPESGGFFELENGKCVFCGEEVPPAIQLRAVFTAAKWHLPLVETLGEGK